MKRSNLTNFTGVFGVVAIVVGLLIEIIATIAEFNTPSSAEGVVAGATLLAIGMAFLQSRSTILNIILLALSALGFGYFVLVQTQGNWLWTVLTVILVTILLGYFLEVRMRIRRNHSNWY